MRLPDPSSPEFPASETPLLACKLCGHPHAPVALRTGQRALCVQCGGLLAKKGRFGAHASLAFAVTGLILAVPALSLPFITVAKFGNVRVNLLSSGSGALWDDGMGVLAVWVFICSALGPVLLFATMIALLAGRTREGFAPVRLHRALHALEHWAMPEVYVLAVLVALFKLGTLVNVFIEPGFWCYTAMSIVLLLAWRSFEFETTTRGAAEPAAAPP